MLKVGIERFLYFEEKKTGRQTAVPICINTFTVDKFLTGNGILNPGDREEDDQSSEWRSLPRHHNTLHQWGRKIILDKFLLIQFYDRSCIKLLKDLYWYYFLFRALVSLFPAPVLSLVWRPWWSHLGLSGAGTLPAPTPLEMFFSFKISFSMLSSAFRQGIRMNCIAPGPIETEVMIWTFSCFCLDSLDCFAFCLIMLGLPRYLFLPCSVILQGAFGRLDPTGEAGKTMMDQIPVVGQLWYLKKVNLV